MTAVDAAPGPAQVQAEMSLSVLSRPAVAIARLDGELDIATTPALRERMLSVFSPGLRLLVLDLSGVSFCDVSALAVLVATKHRAMGLGSHRPPCRPPPPDGEAAARHRPGPVLHHLRHA